MDIEAVQADIEGWVLVVDGENLGQYFGSS